MEDGEKAPIGYQKVNFHMVFEFKMEDLCWKARLIAGGYVPDNPETIAYFSILSRKTGRLALTLEVPNYLEVEEVDTQNDYITEPVTENILTVLGPQFEDDDGKVVLIFRALYVPTNYGSEFINHLEDCMKHMGYVLCLSDPDLWMKPMVISDDYLSTMPTFSFMCIMFWSEIMMQIV